MKKIIIVAIFASISLTAKDFTVTTSGGLSMLQQQVKEEVGGQNFPTLYNHTEINMNLEVRYKIYEFLSAGAYIRYDFGNRQYANSPHSSEYSGITYIIDTDLDEVWLGPIVKGHYKNAFLGLGYGLSAKRVDNFLGLSNEEEFGNSLTTNYIAWLVQLGGKFDLIENLELNIMVEYRVRYYDKVNELNIKDDYIIGTQNFTPMAGISYNFDL